MAINIKAIEKIQKERNELAKRKNADYGSAIDNIGSAGLIGIAVRLFDKTSRLMSLVVNGQTARVKEESIRDTLIDIGNYGDFGVSLIDKTWNKTSQRAEAKESKNPQNEA